MIREFSTFESSKLQSFKLEDNHEKYNKIFYTKPERVTNKIINDYESVMQKKSHGGKMISALI